MDVQTRGAPIIGRLFGADNRPKHYRRTSSTDWWTSKTRNVAYEDSHVITLVSSAVLIFGCLFEIVIIWKRIEVREIDIWEEWFKHFPTAVQRMFDSACWDWLCTRAVCSCWCFLEVGSGTSGSRSAEFATCSQCHHAAIRQTLPFPGWCKWKHTVAQVNSAFYSIVTQWDEPGEIESYLDN